MQLVGYINDLEKARDAVDSAAELLFNEANSLREEYWDKAIADDEKARYSFNVTRQGTTIRIRWARLTPLRKAGGGIDRVVPKYLPLNKGESYPPAKFKDASQRELALIELYEGQLIWLRDELRKKPCNSAGTFTSNNSPKKTALEYKPLWSKHNGYT